MIALIGAIIYSNTLNAPFQWDDDFNVRDNPIIKDLNYFIHPSEAKRFGLIYYSLRDRYAGYLSFALNYRINGTDVTGYHIVNISIHLLNAFLVYVLIRLLFKTPFLRRSSTGIPPAVAFLTALLFVSHPLQTEAVTYIMMRIGILMVFFYLSAIVLYIKWRLGSEIASPSARNDSQAASFLSEEEVKGDVIARSGATKQSKHFLFYLLSLLCVVLAMKTKENAMTLPLMLLLVEFFFFDGKRSKRLLYLLPFMLALFIIPLTLIGSDRPDGEILGGMDAATRHYTAVISRSEYFFTQLRVILTYIRLFFYPANQNIDYDYPTFRSPFEPQVFLSFLFLLAIFTLAIYLFLRSRKAASLRVVSFGIFYFFLSLSVESSIFPIPMIICEYRFYLPGIGLIAALASGGAMLLNKLSARAARAGSAIAIFAFAIPLIFGAVSYARNDIWRSRITLWEDAAKKSPLKPRVHMGLALAYETEGRPEMAIESYEKTLSLSPDYLEARNNLGLLYASMGEMDKAAEHFRISLRFKPDNADVHVNLANVFAVTGRTKEAIEHYGAAVALMPGNESARYNLAMAHIRTERIDLAKKELQALLLISPRNVKARGLLDEISNAGGR